MCVLCTVMPYVQVVAPYSGVEVVPLRTVQASVFPCACKNNIQNIARNTMYVQTQHYLAGRLGSLSPTHSIKLLYGKWSIQKHGLYV